MFYAPEGVKHSIITITNPSPKFHKKCIFCGLLLLWFISVVWGQHSRARFVSVCHFFWTSMVCMFDCFRVATVWLIYNILHTSHIKQQYHDVSRSCMILLLWQLAMHATSPITCLVLTNPALFTQIRSHFIDCGYFMVIGIYNVKRII